MNEVLQQPQARRIAQRAKQAARQLQRPRIGLGPRFGGMLFRTAMDMTGSDGTTPYLLISLTNEIVLRMFPPIKSLIDLFHEIMK